MKSLDRSRRRKGFALIMVMGQMTILVSFWSIANRQTGNLLSLETTLVRRVRRDQGSLSAVARGIGLLETGVPTTSPFKGATTLTTLTGPVTYILTFTDLTEGKWQVEAAQAAPFDNTDPLPTTFALSP